MAVLGREEVAKAPLPVLLLLLGAVWQVRGCLLPRCCPPIGWRSDVPVWSTYILSLPPESRPLKLQCPCVYVDIYRAVFVMALLVVKVYLQEAHMHDMVAILAPQFAAGFRLMITDEKTKLTYVYHPSYTAVCWLHAKVFTWHISRTRYTVGSATCSISPPHSPTDTVIGSGTQPTHDTY